MLPFFGHVDLRKDLRQRKRTTVYYFFFHMSQNNLTVPGPYPAYPKCSILHGFTAGGSAILSV